MKHNSLVEFYSSLVVRLHADAARTFGASTAEVTRDVEFITQQIATGGMSFFTKDLPRLGKALDLSLGRLAPFEPVGFPTGPDGLPLFMRWMWQRLFPRGADVPSWDEVHSHWVRVARQVCLMLYKLELPYEAKDTKKVLDDFVSTDAELPKLDIKPGSIVKDLIRRARVFTTRVFAGFDHWDILPKHGPGAVATGERGMAKYHFSRLYNAIEQVYPFTEYFMFNLEHVARKGSLDYLESHEAGTAKAVLVPKDSRGPRLISCEPLEYQWVQQGLGNKIRQHLENHPRTCGRINFRRQSVNQRLALIGSATGEWATLDLKEASDRVSLELVEELFQGTPLLIALKATRSVATRLPDGRLVTFKKFAPMGSNLCFPVEAFVFYAIARAALERKYAGRRGGFKSTDTGLYVYGDDIICRTDDVGVVREALEHVGLVINEQKCCIEGPFRESCGMEAYQGHDVTPVRLRTVWNSKRVVASVIASYTSYANALGYRGFGAAAEFLMEEVQSLLVRSGRRTLPYFVRKEPKFIYVNCPAKAGPILRHSLQDSDSRLGFFCDRVTADWYNSMYGTKQRFNKRLQRVELQGYQLAVRTVRGEAEGYELMLGNWYRLVPTIHEDWTQWDQSNVVAAQLRAATRSLPPDQLPLAHTLALVSAWKPLA